MKFNPSRRCQKRNSRYQKSSRRLRLESLENRRLLATDVVIQSPGDPSTYDAFLDIATNTVTFTPFTVGQIGPGFAIINPTAIQAEMEAGFDVIIETNESLSTGIGNITIDAPINKTNLGGNVSLRFNADGSIIANAGINAVGSELDVIFNSDRDNDNIGRIAISAGASIATNGGDVVMGGGTAPIASPAMSSAANEDAVLVDAAITTSGGSITIRGSAPATATGGSGVHFGSSSSISSAAGLIDVTGDSVFGNGIAIDRATIESAGGGSNFSGTSDSFYGIQINAGTVADTGSGDITLTASSNTGSGIDVHSGIGPGVVSVTDGNLTINAAVAASTANQFGVIISSGGVIESTSNGSVTVSGSVTQNGIGVQLQDLGTTIRSAGGGIQIIGTGGDSAEPLNAGVRVLSSMVEDTGNGSVAVTGTAGFGNDRNFGIELVGSTIRSAGGGISLVGTGTGLGDQNDGVRLDTATLTDTGEGDISVTGTAGSGSNLNLAVRFSSLTVAGTSGSITTSGNVQFTGNNGTISASSLDLPIEQVISASNIRFDGITDISDQPLTGSIFGILPIAGDLRLETTDTLRFDVDGNIPRSDLDQVLVTGGVNLGNAKLNLNGAITSNLGQVVTLIENDLSDPVVGTFAGLPEGSSLILNESVFDISYVGGDGNDVTLTQVDTYTAFGDGTDETFELTSDPTSITLFRNAVPVATILKSSVNRFVVNSVDGDDVLRLDFTNGSPLPAGGIAFDGGIGGNDSMEIVNGTASTVTHTFLNANDGSVDIDGAAITYVGLEPILDNLDVNDRVFNFAGADETITIDADITPGFTRIDSTLGESVSFAPPNHSLSINSTNGNDIVNVESFGLGFSSALSIATSEDEVNFNARAVLGTSDPGNTGDVSIIAGNITLNTNALIDTRSAALASQTGHVTLEATQSITLDNAAVITQDGTITFDAGSAANNTNNYTGISLDAGSVQTMGTGDIDIFAAGDSDGTTSGQVGVLVDGTIIGTGGNGNILISGTGGAGVDGNIGVLIQSDADVASLSGNLTISGSGNGTGIGNIGVQISSSRVLNISSGNVEIDGIGAAGTDFNHGVSFDSGTGGQTLIDANLGSIVVTGSSDGTGSSNDGITVNDDANIINQSTGLIDLNGTAGAGGIAMSFRSGDISVSAPNGVINVNAVSGRIGTPDSSINGFLFDGDGVNVTGDLAIGQYTGAPNPGFGILRISENLSFDASSTLTMQVDGTTAGIDRDQLIKAGSGQLELNGATLNVTGTIASNPSQTLTLIQNDAPDAIVGTFAGLAEGEMVQLNGLNFAISYIGGDGNDVTLTEQAATNTFAGTDLDEDFVLAVNGPDVELFVNNVLQRSFPLGSLVDFTINAAGGSDSLTVDYSGGNPIPSGGLVFNGGDPSILPGDSVVVTGGSVNTITHTFLNESDGSIDIDGSLISYTGLEPIIDEMDAVNRVFNFEGGTETINLGDDPNTIGANLIDSTLGESVTFTNPSRSLTINTGDGDDVINITTLDIGNQSSLIVDGGTGTSDTLMMDGVNLNTNNQGRGLELRELETISINTGTISNNTANLSNGLGGGILIENSTSGTNTTALIDSVTITGNTASLGGGVYASGVDLTIEDASTVSGNSVSVDGGGVYVDGGSAAIISTNISGNTAGDSGGGVYLDSAALTLESSTISNNQALGSDSGGGGVYLLGSGLPSPAFSIVDTNFSSNTASSGGGGLEIVDNPGTITGGIYELNSVTGGILENQGGGAIVVLAGNSPSSPAISITGVTIRQNTAPTGGALAAVNPNLTLDSVLIENNSTINTGGGFPTAGVGGGIALLGDLDGGNLTITNSKILNNSAVSDAGGIGSADVDVTLINTTISSNGSSIPIGGRAGGIGVQGIQRTPVLTANRVTIDNNVSIDDGGGVGLINAGLDFTNVTITNNQSLSGIGGGLVYDNTDVDATRRIAFSTFASNTDPSFPSNIAASGASIDMFATLFADGIGLFDSAFTFNSLGFNTNNSMPPGLNDPTDINLFDTPLLDLADNGGSVATRRTAMEIPQVNDRVTTFGTLVDARGVSRSSSVDPNADVGAFEFVRIRITDSLGQTNITANEGDGLLDVLVGPDHALPDVASIDVSLVPAGTDPASIPGDLSATDSTLTFPVGDSTPQPFTITLTDDGEIESTETFGINATTTSPFIDATTIQSLGNLTDNDVVTSTFDLSLTKTVNQTVASPGADQLTYTIVVTNEANDLTDLFEITDVLPNGLSLISINAPGATSQTFDTSTREILVQYPSILAGQVRTFTITTDVLASATGTLTNTASVVAPTVTESNTINNFDSVSVTLSPVADVRVTKAVDVATAQPGQQITYTVNVENLGPAVSTSVIAVDTLPSGVTFVSGIGPNGPLSDSNQIVTVDIGQLAPGAITSFTIVVTINNAVINDQVNSVSVSTNTNETDLTNNTATTITRIAQSNTSIVGHVYCDANGDGMENPGEKSFEATVFIDANNNGLLDSNETSTLTNSNGDYSFPSLPSGTQQVTLIVPSSSCSAVPANFPTIWGPQLGAVIRDAFAFDYDGDGLDEFLTVAENSRDLIILSADLFQSGVSVERIALDNRPQSVHAWRSQSSGPSSTSSTSIAVAAFGAGQTTGADGLQRTNPGVVYTIDGSGNVDQFTAGQGPIDVVVDDFDGDDRPDYLVASYLSKDFHLKLSGSQSTVQIGTANGAVHVNSADLDGDGDRDLILGSYGYGQSSVGSLQVRLNNGQGVFSTPMTVPLSSRLISTTVADVDFDGQTSPFSEELIALGVDGRVTVYSVSASGVDVLSSLQLESGTSKIVAGFIDSDNEIDLAVVRNKPRTVQTSSTSPASGTVDLLLNDGAGNFKRARSINEIDNPAAIAFASLEDFDRHDLIVAEQSSDLQGGSTTLVRLGMDQQPVTVSGSAVMTANFNPSSDHSKFDVNGDARVTTVDALQIINEINASESGVAEPSQTAAVETNGASRTVVTLPSAKDVNRDGHVTALDALMVINYLNSLDFKAASAEPVNSADLISPMDDNEFRRDAVDAAMLEPSLLF
ncbi:dockerin type I domain-containing protein [Rhodopirellula sp. SWK7]|uniref:dockerin type I domain-containing protein n=1 Tax=Rhodopirellula sp. SWK7 TaxID=595460 RepID=UPI000A0131C3|nr:dockerin type I domain-containing protein [Rhodopirellula sp. SWK7]